MNNINVTVYDGMEDCSWNGGRINRDNIVLTEKEVQAYYNLSVGIALTFSNPEIDLTDEVGLQLLERFHRVGNKIILVNETLRKFIVQYYPKYELIYSITGLGSMNVPMSHEDLFRYIKLQDDYNYIVPRMEHTFDEMFLNLDQSKYEIMVNDTCIYGCPYFKEHFEMIASQNKSSNPWDTIGYDTCFKIEECWLKGFNPSTGDTTTIDEQGENYGMDLTVEQIQRLIDRNVTSFKVTGRENSAEDMKDELDRYIGVLNDR